MFTLNGVRNGAGKGAPVINGGKYARINGNVPYQYDNWRMIWNGNHFAPPPAGSLVWYPGVPGQGTVLQDFAESYSDSGIDTNEALDATETGVDCDADATTAIPANSVILIDSEKMFVTATGTTLTVNRGYANSVAATHSTNADIYVWTPRDGTITGATWNRLPSGLWYLDFVTDDVVQRATHLITPIQAFSFACWAREDTGSGSLYAEGRTAGISPFFKIWFNTTTIAVSARNDANTEVSAYSSNGTSAGVWHFIGVNCDGAGTYRFHIDNNHYAETADTMAGAFTLLAKFSIGATDRNVLGDFFDGGIALLRIVTTSWTDATFDSYYQRERSLFGV